MALSESPANLGEAHAIEEEYGRQIETLENHQSVLIKLFREGHMVLVDPSICAGIR